MARNIALTLTLDGVEQTITTIGQLEEAIKQAKTQLSGLEIGSQEFQKLQTQIRQADGALKNLQERTEGKKIEETIGRYAKIGAAITGSFAAAQAAFALFGGESENIAKAAAQAQNLLTIALVGRELAEASVAAATLIADLATKAQTASTIAADSATKRFYATLAANPYTALLVGVGLLIAAIVTLTSKTDEAKKKQIELQKAVDEGASKEIAKLKILKETLESDTTSRKEKEKAIEDAKKQFGPYLATLDQEKLLTGEITIEYDKLTEALIRKAKAEVFAQEIAKLSLKELELKRQLTKATNDQTKAQENLRDAEKISRGVVGSGSVPGLGGAGQVGVIERQRLIGATKEFDQAQKNLNVNLQQQQVYLDEINKANQQNNNLLGDGTVKIEDNTGAQKLYIEALQQRLNVQIEVIKGLEKLNEVDGKVSADVINRANKLLADAQALIDKRNQFFKSEGETLTDEINDLLFKIIPSSQQLKTIQDGYLAAFNSIGNAIKEGSVKLLDDNGKAVDFSITSIQERLKERGIAKNLIDAITEATPEAQTALVEFYTRLAATAERLTKGFNLSGQIIQFDKTTIEKNLGELISETQRILQDPTILKGLKNTEIQKVIDGLFKIETKTLKDFGGNTEEAKIKLDAYNEGVKSLKASLLEFGKVQATQAIDSKKVGDELAKVNAEIRKAREELGLLNEVSDISGGAGPKNLTLSLEQQIKFIDFLIEKLKTTPAALDDILNDVSENYQKYVNRFGKEGLELLLVRVAEGFENLDNYTSEQLNDLLITLSNNAKDISTQYGDEVAGSFEALLERIKKALKQIPTESETAFKESLEKITNAIQTFQAVLTSLQQTTADYYAFQLDRLDKQNESIQSKIVENTKRGTELRLEQEKIYQTKRQELEKKQAKTALGLQLVQGISNTALAVIRALAEGGPIAGPILAGIVGGIGAFQVGIIGAQLALVDQFKRGGMLAMGGMVNGPSHEYGGVKYQGGGFELEGNEAVINRRSSLNYMGLLSQINQSGGGVPIYNSFDDSRIVEAIYKQRNEPIRAFVVESDITNKQQITRRLEQLSQF